MQSKVQIKSIGIDLGKTTFHLIALGTRSQVVTRKKFSRCQLLEYTANLPSSLIGMEAGVGSHFLGRALREQGHEVRLIPAQFVRPFVKSNKNDYCDAEAIAEAVERENTARSGRSMSRNNRAQHQQRVVSKARRISLPVGFHRANVIRKLVRGLPIKRFHIRSRRLAQTFESTIAA